jgi:hypothetical protein
MRTLSFQRLAIFLLFLAIATTACLMGAQSDTYWQLRAGQEMIASGHVLLEDTFTYTVRGGYWPNHEWLSQVAFYLLYRAGGFPLLTLFLASLIVLAWTSAWQLMRGSPAARLGLMMVLLVPSARLWSVRPQLISLGLLGVACWLIKARRMHWLPLLFVIWANFHGGVMLGLAAVGGALAGTVWVRRSEWKRAAAVLTACAAAVCVTPLGITIWTEIPHMLQRLSMYDVQEWRPSSLVDPWNLPFWSSAILLLALVWRRRRSLDSDTAMTVGAAIVLLPLAIKSTRNMSSFLLLAGPALSHVIPDAVANWKLRDRRERPVVNTGLAAVLTVCCALTVMVAWKQPAERLNWTPIPREMASRVAACPGNLYNLYDHGGYLVWFVREKPVFMDSRQDPFPPELVLEQIRIERKGGYEQVFAKYGVGCAVLPPASRLAKQLKRADWRLVYSNAYWDVLQHPAVPAM